MRALRKRLAAAIVRIVLPGALCALFHPMPARAVPALLNYQGHLSNGGGPITGTFPMTFSLYGAPSGGAPLWSETHASVTVSSGTFAVLLGSNTVLPLGSIFAGQTLWIETVVDGNTMAPRRPIVSVAYAARAAIADSAVAVPPAVPAGSVVYTLWGRSSCPAGATKVYDGFAASGHYQHTGSGRNMLCLTETPTFDVFNDGDQNGALIYGVEYEMNGYGLAGAHPYSGLQDDNAPCVVCLRENVRVSLMIPGAHVCPVGWTLEYAGHLMAPHYTGGAGEFVCVDRQAHGIGSNLNQNGSLWFPVEAECGSLPCGPYIQNRELTCAVCTRP